MSTAVSAIREFYQHKRVNVTENGCDVKVEAAIAADYDDLPLSELV
jgi:hypothetical protein